jgi:hypothetical protein
MFLRLVADGNPRHRGPESFTTILPRLFARVPPLYVRQYPRGTGIGPQSSFATRFS